MHSAAILAGGRATRFGGRDKGALIVEGRTILDRLMTELSTLTDDIMIVGGAGRHPQARSIVDEVEGCGPLGGIHAALRGARTSTVLVVACDMPYVTAPLAAYLLGLAREADAVVPQTERGWHPLAAVYTRGCLDTIVQRLADGRWTLRDLFAEVRTRVVTGEEIERFGNRHRLLANVNTPAEYAGLEALQGHTL